MPTLSIVDKLEAQRESLLNSPRGAHLRVYLGYLDSLDEGKAGVLELSEGDSVYRVRKALRTAAELKQVSITIKANGKEGPVYFWLDKETDKPKRVRRTQNQPD